MTDFLKIKIIDLINKELKREYQKFGNQESKTILEWIAIITEEYLELLKSINDSNDIGTKRETIHTICCLLHLLNKFV